MVFGLSFQENGNTALHVAVRRKDLEMMRLLVDHKGDVNQQNVSLDFMLPFTVSVRALNRGRRKRVKDSAPFFLFFVVSYLRCEISPLVTF